MSVQGSAGTLVAVLEALLRGASTHVEPQTRKTCVQVSRQELSIKGVQAASCIKGASLCCLQGLLCLDLQEALANAATNDWRTFAGAEAPCVGDARCFRGRATAAEGLCDGAVCRRCLPGRPAE